MDNITYEELEQLYKKITNNFIVVIYSVEEYPDKIPLLYVNDVGLKILNQHKVVSDVSNILDLVHPDYKHIVENRIERLLQGQHAGLEEEVFVVGDQEFHAEVSSDLIKYKGIDAVQVFIRDIAVQKYNEGKLAKERIKSENYFELSPNLTVILNCDGNVVNINKAGCDILEGDKEDIINKHWFDTFVPEIIRAEMNDQFNEIIKCDMSASVQFPPGIINNVVTLLGNQQTLEWYNSEFRDESDKLTYIYSTGINITEKVYLEEQLRQVAKLEAIGLLAGGLAHDFNNLLTIIRGYSEMIVKKIQLNKAEETPVCKADYVVERLDKVITSSKRAEKLVKQLLAFSRKQILSPTIFNLNHMLEEEREGLHKLIREDIEVTYFLDTRLGNILADKGEIQSVLINLMINSRDAIKDSGSIIVETKNVYFGNRHIKQKKQLINKGSYVMVAITDDGVGMNKKTVSRVFEPFFTTKELGKGVGLGLSTAYGIVKQSKGYIWVYSEPKQGTTFKLYFPRVEGESHSLVKEQEDFIGDYKGTETILVVEDEKDVRDMISETLKDAGYTVICAPDGADALKLIQNSDTIPDLVLTDVVMPKMDGRELAENIHSILPKVKILFMSGYTDNTIVHRGVLDSGTNFIQKPTTPIQLMKRIREVLDNN